MSPVSLLSPAATSNELRSRVGWEEAKKATKSRDGGPVLGLGAHDGAEAVHGELWRSASSEK